MPRGLLTMDNQQALSFLVSQQTFIEAEVYRIQYPEILYPQLLFVDTSANEWAKSITYFSLDHVAQAEWFSGTATDMKLAELNRQKFEQGIEMAGIGYRWSLEEIGQAMMLGINLPNEKAIAARRAYEEFMDRIVRFGDSRKSFTGMLNSPLIPRATAAATGSGGSTQWVNKTADQINFDVQQALLSVYQGSSTVELADTILLPIQNMQLLSDTRIPNTPITALEYLRTANLYTHTTGRPLTIRGILNLETAGQGGSARMLAYRNDRMVVKVHLPMPHRFLEIWRQGPIEYLIPGIFRTGAVEWRRPLAAQYVDGI